VFGLKKLQTLVALTIIKKLLSADGSALNEVQCSKWFFLRCGSRSRNNHKNLKEHL
jgi:hypothetical protein